MGDLAFVGRVMCLLSATSFGAMAIFGKLAFAAGVTPDALVLLRFWCAAIVLGVLLAVRPGLRPHPETWGSKSGRLRVILLGLGLGAFGYAVQASLYFGALERLDAPVVALILYTYPALVTVGAVLLGRDHFTRTRVLALVVASVGTILVLVGGGAVRFDALGIGLAFGGALVYTAYILIADGVVEQLPPLVLTTLVMIGAALALGVRAVVSGGVSLGFGPMGWVWLACIVVVSTIVAVLTFFEGLARVGPAAASVLSTFEPVVSTVLAAVVLGEVLAPMQLAGAALVLVAAVVVQRRSSGEAAGVLEDGHTPI